MYDMAHDPNRGVCYTASTLEISIDFLGFSSFLWNRKRFTINRLYCINCITVFLQNIALLS